MDENAQVGLSADALAWLPAATRDPHAAIGRLALIAGTRPKGCLHTTEGSGWPSYGNWAIPPHVTVRPIPGAGVEARQHIPFTLASFALENHPGGVETNRAMVFQVELIGTCDPAQRRRLFYWPDADDAVLGDLYRKVVVPMSEGLGIPLTSPRWMAYPASYGPANRLTAAQWLTFAGWCGHEHVPENTHGDPGAFPWDRMINAGGVVHLSDDDVERIAHRTAELITGIGAVHPVLVPTGQGEAHLPDGRDIITLPTAQSRELAALARIETHLGTTA